MDKAKLAAQVVGLIVAASALFGVTVAPEVLDGVKEVVIGVVSAISIVSAFLPSVMAMIKPKEDA